MRTWVWVGLIVTGLGSALASCTLSRELEVGSADPGSGWVVRRHGHRAERVGDGVLVFGGTPEERAGTIWIDGRTGERHSRSKTISHRSFHASVIIAGRAYSIGGGTIDRYDLEDDRWVTVFRDPRIPRSHVSAGACRDRIFVLGGVGAERPGFASFDPRTGVVHTLPVPPHFSPGEHLAHLVEMDGELHVIGGANGLDGQPMARHEIWNGESWRSGTAPPVEMWAKFGTARVLGRGFHVMGEFGHHRLDEDTREWSECAPMPVMLAMPVGVVVSGRLYLLGGLTVEDSPRHRGGVHIYDPAIDRWESYQPPGE